MPPFFAGLRIGSTLAVVGVVVGELVGGNAGLGYLLAFGEGQANTPMVFVAILLLTLVGGDRLPGRHPDRAPGPALHAGTGARQFVLARSHTQAASLRPLGG